MKAFNINPHYKCCECGCQLFVRTKLRDEQPVFFHPTITYDEESAKVYNLQCEHAGKNFNDPNITTSELVESRFQNHDTIP